MAMDKGKKKNIIRFDWRTILFLYGIIPTLQPSNFGRVYAAYGGIFVVMAIMWGLIVDKKRPDKFEIIGGIVVLGGASIIFYGPR